MPLFGPPNIEDLQSKRDVNGLVKAINYKGNKDVPILAIVALKKVGDARAVIPLITVLKDDDSVIRKVAAEALGALKDDRAVMPLIAALKDAHGDVRYHAAKSLGQIGDRRAVEPLIETLQDRGEAHFSARKALEQIGDSRAFEPIINALATELKDPDYHYREEAAIALGKINDDRATDLLLGAHNDQNENVRFTVNNVLGKRMPKNEIEKRVAEQVERARANVKPPLEALDGLNLKVESIGERVDLDTRLMELGYTADRLESTRHLQFLEDGRRAGYKPPRSSSSKPIENISDLLRILSENLEIADYAEAKAKQQKWSAGWGTQYHNKEGDLQSILNIAAECILTETIRIETLTIKCQYGDDVHCLGIIAGNSRTLLAHGLMRAGANKYVYWQHKRDQ